MELEDVKEGVQPETEPQKEIANPVAEKTEGQNADNSAAPETTPKEDGITLKEIEQTISAMSPEEVIKFQRKLSQQTETNLFVGDIGKLFNKYKPINTDSKVSLSKEAVLKAAEIKNKAKEENKPSEPLQNDTQNAVLDAKLELELYKAGIKPERLEAAKIIAREQIKSVSDLSNIASVVEKFPEWKSTAPTPPPQRTGFVVDGDKTEKTDGEKAVEFLKSKNPKGFK